MAQHAQPALAKIGSAVAWNDISDEPDDVIGDRLPGKSSAYRNLADREIDRGPLAARWSPDRVATERAAAALRRSRETGGGADSGYGLLLAAAAVVLIVVILVSFTLVI